MKERDSRFETLSKYVELADLDEVKGRVGNEPLIVIINRSVVTLEASADGVQIGRPPGGAASAVYDSLRQAGGGIVVATATTDVEREIGNHGLLFGVGTTCG